MKRYGIKQLKIKRKHYMITHNVKHDTENK